VVVLVLSLVLNSLLVVKQRQSDAHCAASRLSTALQIKVGPFPPFPSPPPHSTSQIQGRSDRG